MATPKEDTNRNDLDQTVNALGEEIASLLNGIGAVVNSRILRAQRDDCLDWGVVGTLEHIRDRVRETLEAIALDK